LQESFSTQPIGQEDSEPVPDDVNITHSLEHEVALIVRFEFKAWPQTLPERLKRGMTVCDYVFAGVIAKFLTPGSTYEPQGFILTTALGIVGALVRANLSCAA
jgi:hypothetical protein